MCCCLMALCFTFFLFLRQRNAADPETIEAARETASPVNVNVDTDDRLAITAAVREALAAAPEGFAPRHSRAWREGMKQIIAERMRHLGHAVDCAGGVPA